MRVMLKMLTQMMEKEWTSRKWGRTMAQTLWYSLWIQMSTNLLKLKTLNHHWTSVGHPEVPVDLLSRLATGAQTSSCYTLASPYKMELIFDR